MTWALDGKPLRSILVTRLRYLGDLVMSTVVLEILRRGDPDLRLGYLCEDPHGAVLAGHPHLDKVHRLAPRTRGSDARARAGGPAGAGSGSGTLAMATALRAARYDLAVDLFFNPRSAWLLWAAGIPLRIGGTRKWRRRLYTHTVPGPAEGPDPAGWRQLAPGGLGDHLCRLEPLRHAETGLPFREWVLGQDLARPLRPLVRRPAPDPAAVAGLAALAVSPAEPYLVLAPGATWPSKEWPLDRWRELIGLLVAGRPEALVVILPPGRSQPWEGLAEAIPGGRGGVCAPLALPSVLAVVGGARGLVCVDGGIMHAAVGMSVPTTALFGPTDPGTWFPYEGAGPFRVLATRPACHPCHLHQCGDFICLPDLKAAAVASAVAGILAVS